MASTLPTSPGYAPFDTVALRGWLRRRPALAARLGGDAADWRVDEVGDGNLNLVYLVRGPAGGLCVKQSLPYVRVAGESWPLPLERVWFEYRSMAETGPIAAGLVPELIDYDAERFALVMELLPQHKILRRALVDGEMHPKAVEAVAEYAARTAVATSPMAAPFETVFERLAVFARNQALTRITADLVFADPLIVHPRNRWTSPQLDDLVARFRADAPLRLALARWGHAFLTRHESLLHGDLHTGSVMVGLGPHAGDTRIIDSEFALYGPVGFDLGAFVANLLVAFHAQKGHETRPGDRAELRAWLLQQIPRFWHRFAERYAALWRERTESGQPADAYPASLFADAAGRELLATERQALLQRMLADVVGFAGAEIIRRTIGFAHNLDFESIADAERRARCERGALELARRLLVEPESFPTIESVADAARASGG